MTVVIDCNVLVMCLTSRSPYHVIYKSLVTGRFNLAVSNDILLEYEEIIQRKYSMATSNALLGLLSELDNVLNISPYYRWQLIDSDQDDNKYCDCAIAGQCDYVVTEDKHFDALSKISFPSLAVIGIENFTRLLS